MHQWQRPQVRIEPRNTRSPFFTPGGSIARGPTSSRTPTGSWPSIHGEGALGSPLKNVRASVPHIPQASTLSTAPSGSTSGSGVLRISTTSLPVMKAGLSRAGQGREEDYRIGPQAGRLFHVRDLDHLRLTVLGVGGG